MLEENNNFLEDDDYDDEDEDIMDIDLKLNEMEQVTLKDLQKTILEKMLQVIWDLNE